MNTSTSKSKERAMALLRKSFSDRLSRLDWNENEVGLKYLEFWDIYSKYSKLANPADDVQLLDGRRTSFLGRVRDDLESIVGDASHNLQFLHGVTVMRNLGSLDAGLCQRYVRLLHDEFSLLADLVAFKAQDPDLVNALWHSCGPVPERLAHVRSLLDCQLKEFTVWSNPGVPAAVGTYAMQSAALDFSVYPGDVKSLWHAKSLCHLLAVLVFRYCHISDVSGFDASGVKDSVCSALVPALDRIYSSNLMHSESVISFASLYALVGLLRGDVSRYDLGAFGRRVRSELDAQHSFGRDLFLRDYASALDIVALVEDYKSEYADAAIVPKGFLEGK